MAEQGTRDVVRVGIVGCGTMGSGIAEITARRGMPVAFVEVDDAAVERGLARIAASLDRQVQRGKLEADERDTILSHISGGTDLSSLADCDLVLEAVPELLDLKQDVFAQLDAIVRPDAILATNTSSLPVMDLASTPAGPTACSAFHFFKPRAGDGADRVGAHRGDRRVGHGRRQRFAEAIGKTPVWSTTAGGSSPTNLLFPYLNQAVSMVESGYATKEDVDAAMRFGAGLPMGPIALTDLIGMGHLPGHHGRDPRPVPGHPLRAAAGARTARGGRVPGAQVGSWVLPVRRAGVVAGRPGRWHARACRSRTRRGLDHRRGAGPPARWRRASSRSVPRRVSRWSSRGRSREKADGVVATVSRSLQRMVDKGRVSADAMDETLRRIHPTADLEDLAPSDVGDRSGRGGPRHQAGRCSTNWRRSSRPRRSCRPRPRRCRDRLRDGHRAPRTPRRSALLQPGRDHEARGDRVHRAHRPAGRRAGARLRRTHRQGRGALRRPVGVHRQRAAVPLPQRRRQDARDALRDGRGDRHRHCGSGAATRWDRSN